MELLVLAISKRFALGGIASLAERPSKNKAERSEAERLQGQSFPAGAR
jgi:hypothetical protein